MQARNAAQNAINFLAEKNNTTAAAVVTALNAGHVGLKSQVFEMVALEAKVEALIEWIAAEFGISKAEVVRRFGDKFPQLLEKF